MYGPRRLRKVICNSHFNLLVSAREQPVRDSCLDQVMQQFDSKRTHLAVGVMILAFTSKAKALHY